MNFSIIKSIQVSGISGEIISIETDVSRGLSMLQIVGLGDRAVDESRERILSALKNCGLPSPKTSNQKVVVSLSPSHKKKYGSGFDLPIAISYLKAVGELPENQKIFVESLFIGELSLDGKIKPVPGVVPMILTANKLGYKNVFIPNGSCLPNNVAQNINIYPCKNLKQITNHLKGKFFIKKIAPNTTSEKDSFIAYSKINFFKIKGQCFAKRGLEIAVAGGHHIIFNGSPGTGKTFLAQSVKDILPHLNDSEKIQCSIINSISEHTTQNDNVRPFRTPHNNSSYTSIIGGGSHKIQPGEVTLAHNGILFMDEFSEFNKNILEALRQPLETGSIIISRAHQKIKYPANFLLIAATNPCPCGYHKSNRHKCSCTVSQIKKYRQKISGPILDRIDMWINLDDIEYDNLVSTKPDLNEAEIKNFLKNIERVRKNKNKIKEKYKNEQYYQKLLSNQPEIKRILDNAAKKFSLSARGYFKIIKIAHTISDLDNCKKIKEKHLLEALQYRPNI